MSTFRKNEKIQTRVTPYFFDKLKKLAEIEKRSISQMAARLIEDALTAREQQNDLTQQPTIL